MAHYEIHEEPYVRTRTVVISTDHLRPELHIAVVVSHELLMEQREIDFRRVFEHLLWVAEQFEALLRTETEVRAAAPLFELRMQRAFMEALSQSPQIRSDYRRSDYYRQLYDDAFLQGGEARYINQEEAERKARTLLFRFLSTQQKQTLERERHFDVRGQDGKNYRLHEARSNNIEVDGKRLCAGPEGPLPLYDLLLAQKLLLETEASLLISRANHNYNFENLEFVQEIQGRRLPPYYNPLRRETG